MLSSSKELGIIKRKRKSPIREFDPYNKEEKKEPSWKRQINDEGNQRITEWWIKKTPIKNKKKNKIEINRKIVKQMKWTLTWIH